MENKKGIATKAPILSAAITLLIGFIDVAATTKFFTNTYKGILSFIVGQKAYTSAIIAGVVWLILAIAAFFLVKYIKRIPRKALIIGAAALITIVAVISVVQSNNIRLEQEAKEAALSATAYSDISSALKSLETELLAIKSLREIGAGAWKSSLDDRTNAVNELMKEYLEFEKRDKAGEVTIDELVEFSSDFLQRVRNTVQY
ncbi:hypothetical protein LJC34_06430 [Oscillospiraceae bacterium OttesenSCG-928-G22]|nr:hypothetical protein [Oscillospiraceae bacterium OttesenSCG-928-G22]